MLPTSNLNPSSPSSGGAKVAHVEHAEPPPSSPPATYPREFYDDDLSVGSLEPSARPNRSKAPSGGASGLTTSPRHDAYYDVQLDDDDEDDDDDADDEGYHADFRSDLGDEFYAGADDKDENQAETRTDRLPINRYDGLVYVTSGSPSPTSSLSSASSSSSPRETDDERTETNDSRRSRQRQTTMGNSETSWEDASPATSTSQALYSPPPPKPTKLNLPEYRYAPITASLPSHGPSYDPHVAPTPRLDATSTETSSIDYEQHHYHHLGGHYPHHHHDAFDAYSSHLVETYAQSAAPSPAISPSNSGASTPRGRNPHPRLLWRSHLSSDIIDALDAHHRKIAGCPLPRIEPPATRHSTFKDESAFGDHEPTTMSTRFDVVPEREGTGKLDVEVRERDKERERGRMGKNRKPLSREGRRWSRAVEKWGL